jgi:transcriptional regulator with XRE-family HTH domain
MCGVSRPAINDIESGKTKTLRAQTLMRLATALQVDPSWLHVGVAQRDRSADVLSSQELQLIVEFRRLDNAERKIVVRIVRALAIDK